MMYRVMFVVLCSVSSTLSKSLIPCKITEPNCIEKTSAQAYRKFFEENSELGTENLDPMHHNVIDGNLSLLKFKLTNITVTGFKDCKIANIKINAATFTLLVELLCPHLSMFGTYDIHGRIIALPVEGNGDFRIEAKTYRISVDAEMKVAPGKDGKNYISVKNFRQNAEPLEGITFDFKNLFNGQKDLADALLKFVNENWLEVAKEIQGPIFAANLKKIMKNSNKYFKSLPLEDLISI